MLAKLVGENVCKLFEIVFPKLRTVVEQALSDFVGRHLAFNSNRLFKLIEVISFLNSDLVRRVLPKIREQVAITESKRGTGIDSILRYVFISAPSVLISFERSFEKQTV